MTGRVRWLALPVLLTGAALRAADSTPLEAAVLEAVRAAHFEGVVDFLPGDEQSPVSARLGKPAATAAHCPNVNAAVLQFDADGRLAGRAYVLLSRDYPEGVVVPLDDNLSAGAVTFLHWDIERFDGGAFGHDGSRKSTKGWTNNPPLTPADILAPGEPDAPLQFMAPYPASLFKTMVAFHVMRMLDAGKLALGADYAYEPPHGQTDIRPIRAWLDGMLTVSDNHCTAALIKMFHDHNEIDPLNQEFQDLNLPTLQLKGTDPATGHGWDTAKIQLTAWDVAKLFWLIDGGPGEFWRDAKGRPVTEKILSPASRMFLKMVLSEQAFNDCLTTANYHGNANVRPGIPSRVAERWIEPATGHVVVHGTDYGGDIREANARAEVNFAHKTGLTFNYGSDAGIVTSLPGKPFRHYIIAFTANLGYRYADPVFASRTKFPAFENPGPIAYTQKIPAFGQMVDAAVTRLSAGKN